MDIDDLRIGMSCHLTAMGNRVFTITEINPQQLMPIGIGVVGQAQTQMYVRPITVKPLTILGHTNN